MPMNLADYHSSWPDISRQIREQAGNVCEFCKAPNGERVYRNVRGEWMREDDLDHRNSTEAYAWLGTFEPEEPRRIVLTVAHLCHDTTCYDPTHLRALCQRCHLNLDRPHHIAKARETRQHNRAAAIAATGQGALL